MINNVTICTFSPRGTTRQTAHLLADSFSLPTKELNLLNHPLTAGQNLPGDTLLIAAMPVYAGRIPSLCAQMLNNLTGNNTPAIALAVYGNRDYEDALLELSDLLSNNGFHLIAAGAFIAQHSIFTSVAQGRPDNADQEKLASFGAKCKALLTGEPNSRSGKLQIKGKRPYKEAKPIPIIPSADKHCTSCGACAQICPKGAINRDNPTKTDREKCISCGACISICPVDSRSSRGVMYAAAAKKFEKKCVQRKEPETFFPE